MTGSKKDYNKHCATRKHKMEINRNNITNETNKAPICSHCNKQYVTQSGLWKHSQKCSKLSKSSNSQMLAIVDNNEPIKNYIIQLIEQNKNLSDLFAQKNEDFKNEIKTMLSEQPVQVTNIQNNIQNNNNKTINNFNLTVFLQETCKDALNMSQFIDTLQINPQSVEYTGTHGYVNGITKIFMDGLNQLDIHERPIHCTDLKRETLYIKEDNKWEKDTEDKTKFRHALATVVDRNISQVKHWEEENPRCKIPETDEYEFYFVIARQSLGGGNHDVTARNNDRILRAIAGKVYLDKKTKEIQ